MGSIVYKRQEFVVVNGNSRNWWYSQTAFIVKWAVFGGITLIFLLWFVGGYYHARRRMRKGLAPLRYHRFLVPQAQRAQWDPSLQNQFTFYQIQDQGYGMEPMAPPVYDPNHVPPPTYQPPNGASKAHPVQEYTAPPGPPPQQNGGPESPPPTARSTRPQWLNKIIPGK